MHAQMITCTCMCHSRTHAHVQERENYIGGRGGGDGEAGKFRCEEGDKGDVGRRRERNCPETGRASLSPRRLMMHPAFRRGWSAPYYQSPRPHVTRLAF